MASAQSSSALSFGRRALPCEAPKRCGLACPQPPADSCLSTTRHSSGSLPARASCGAEQLCLRHKRISHSQTIRSLHSTPSPSFLTHQKNIGRQHMLKGNSHSRGSPNPSFTCTASSLSSTTQQPGSKNSATHGTDVPFSDTPNSDISNSDSNPSETPLPQASGTLPTHRRAVLLTPLALTTAAWAAALSSATEASAAGASQQQWREPIRKLEDNFGVAVLLATEESLIDTGRITRYDLQKEFFKLRQQEFAPLKKANFGGLRSLGQELNVNDVPYFNFQSYIQWKLVSKKLRGNEERKDFNLAVGRRLLERYLQALFSSLFSFLEILEQEGKKAFLFQDFNLKAFNLAVGRRLLERYLPDVAAQALSTCPDYQVASTNQQQPASPEGYSAVSTSLRPADGGATVAAAAPNQRLPNGATTGEQSAATSQEGASLQGEGLWRPEAYQALNGGLQGEGLWRPEAYQALNDGLQGEALWRPQPDPTTARGYLAERRQGQASAHAVYVNMGGVPMADQIVDGMWRGALGGEEERRSTGVCARGVTSAVSTLLEKLKAINFVEDFDVNWSDVADGVPEAGQKGSAILSVKLKGPADLQGGVLIRAEENNFWQRITSSMLSALFEELGVNTAVDEFFFRETYKPKSLLEQAVLSLGDPLLPVIDVDVDEISETWRLSWA